MEKIRRHCPEEFYCAMYKVHCLAYGPHFDEELAKKMIRLFLIHVDRTVLDSFSHANVGPRDTKAGRIILEVEAELEQAVPNITMKYDEDIPDARGDQRSSGACKKNSVEMNLLHLSTQFWQNFPVKRLKAQEA